MSFYKILTIICSISVINAHTNEDFHEELFIKPLQSGHVNTFFQFTNRWKIRSKMDLHHTYLFPRAISEIIYNFDVKELHISLTQGLWRYGMWGYPVSGAPPGVEVWSWFGPSNDTDHIDSKWKRMCGKLSGVLCASTNFIDGTNTVKPKFSFRPQFSTNNGNFSEYHIRYATLPRENVCTENLTPWKKLLPCTSGLASLLNSGYVHNANYHSLNIEMRTLCETSSWEHCVIELKLFANFVFDPTLIGGDADFSIRKMFGQGNHGYCPLAKSSKIYIDMTEDSFNISPTPHRILKSARGGATTIFGEYDLQTEGFNKFFNIAWKNKERPAVPIYAPPKLTARRYSVGHGQEYGKISTEIANNHWAPIKILLQENIPWFIHMYLHTMTIITDRGDKVRPDSVHYVPGRDRERPYHLELALTLPAETTTRILIDFDYIFLKWSEYPPDANHGYYVGSAIITAILPNALNYTGIPVDGLLFEDSFNASRSFYFHRIYTEILLVTLPVPDFSMPYNVICLACTVVALAFGPIHSAATKRIVVEDQTAEPQTILGKLKWKILGRKRTEIGENEGTEESDRLIAEESIKDEQTKKDD